MAAAEAAAEAAEMLAADAGEGQAPRGFNAHHDGSVSSLLDWFKASNMPALKESSKGNNSTESKRHAMNYQATLANVQARMDDLGISRRVDEPIEQR